MIGGAGGVSSLLPFDGVDKRGVFSDDIFLLVAIVSQGNQLTSIGRAAAKSLHMPLFAAFLGGPTAYG